jgi:CHAD domain-containing protein
MPRSQTDSPADLAQRKLLDLTQKRLEKFVSLVPKVLVTDDPDAIHDMRVWSRRLQQVVRVLFPKPRNGKPRKITRALRRARRALGACRNLDVSMQLAEQRLETANSSAARNAWDQLREYLLEKKRAEIVRAREDLSQCDMIAFAMRAKSLLKTVDLAKDPQRALEDSMEDAFAVWQQSLERARETRNTEEIHRLRIAGKRLRYRAELLTQLGRSSVRPLVKSLKALQNGLGDWHDRCVMLEYVAECIGRPNFLLNHPEAGRTLLLEMERERHRIDASIDVILKDADKVYTDWASISGS